jgi:hypothetical protein
MKRFFKALETMPLWKYWLVWTSTMVGIVFVGLVADVIVNGGRSGGPRETPREREFRERLSGERDADREFQQALDENGRRLAKEKEYESYKKNH